MATIAPWLVPPNFLGYIEAGSQAGLAKRRAADEESQFAQKMAQEGQQESDRQDDAAQRLKLSYDSLAQQHDLSQQEIAARAMQGQAAMALHQQGQDSLNQWRQQQGQNQQQRLADNETKIAAASALKEKADKDINAFWSDLPDKGLSKSLQDHPFAASEPGIRSAAAQKLINPKAAVQDKIPLANLKSGENTVTGVPFNSPLVNQLGGDDLSKVGGTNYVSAADKLKAASLGAAPQQPSGTALGNLNMFSGKPPIVPDMTGYKSAAEVRADYQLPKGNPNKLSAEDAQRIIERQFPEALQIKPTDDSAGISE